MEDAPISEQDARLVSYLKWLVTGLTVTMIGGLIVLVTVIVMRFNAEGTAPLPESLALPSGTRATAVTRGPDWFAVVTGDDRILIYELDGETLRQEITLTPAQ